MDVLIVGTGLAACMAAHFEVKAGNNVYMVEQSSEFGGLCRTETRFGIVVHKHGPHVFHTSRQDIVSFMYSVCEMLPYSIRVKADIGDTMVDFPINLNTLRQLGIAEDERSARDYFDRIAKSWSGPVNTIRDYGLSTIGKKLFDLFIDGYTQKMWGRKCDMLPSSILERIPFRTNESTSYYNDEYSFVPRLGWTHFLEQLVQGVKSIQFNTKMTLKKMSGWRGRIIYTGRLDDLCEHVMGPLAFRGVEHSHNLITVCGQNVPVINYCSKQNPILRTINNNLLAPVVPDTKYTFYTVERPCLDGGIGCYPIDNPYNQLRQKSYLDRVDEAKQIMGLDIKLFGRLATYRYLNMNQVVEEIYDYYQRRA